MNKLSPAKRAQVVVALVEGNSIRATVRMTGVAKNTVLKLLVGLGAACDRYQRKLTHYPRPHSRVVISAGCPRPIPFAHSPMTFTSTRLGRRPSNSP
jgi:hypothetical protein